MKFYNFENCEYGAVIAARTEEEAIRCYVDEVSEEWEKPEEISIGAMFKIYLSSEIDGCTTDKEKEEKFKMELEEFREDKYYLNHGMLLLVDSSLV